LIKAGEAESLKSCEEFLATNLVTDCCNQVTNVEHTATISRSIAHISISCVEINLAKIRNAAMPATFVPKFCIIRYDAPRERRREKSEVNHDNLQVGTLSQKDVAKGQSFLKISF